MQAARGRRAGGQPGGSVFTETMEGRNRGAVSPGSSPEELGS